MLSYIKKIVDLKNLFVIGVVLILMVLIGIIAPSMVYRHRVAERNEQAVNSGTNQTEKLVNVSYSNHGFDPKTITVSVGTTVAWINQSDKQMWVASDPHPAHNVLPGFDQLGPDARDESSQSKGLLEKVGLVAHAQAHDTVVYKYTFAKKGAWFYHNHLSPGDRGQVIVQ